MQSHDPGRILSLEFAARDGREEVVETKPLSTGVQRHQEKVRPLEIVHDATRTRHLQNRFTQRGREPLEDRNLENEPPNILGLATQHLLDQIVPDVAIVAAEFVYECIGIFSTDQRHRRQVQPGGPALGPFHQLGKGDRGEPDVVDRQ